MYPLGQLESHHRSVIHLAHQLAVNPDLVTDQAVGETVKSTKLKGSDLLGGVSHLGMPMS
jgi:hypothetical protein